MTTVQLRMTDLYDRLSNIGISREFVKSKKILPGWWTDEVDGDPQVVLEGAIHIADRLNLNVSSLLAADENIEFAASTRPRFKLNNSKNFDRLDVPVAIASRVSELVIHGCKQPYLGLENLSVERIREQILSSRSIVDLQGFLEFCWSIGIPVIHCCAFPENSRRFQGMVAYYGERPVIVLSLKDRSPSRLLFVAAHELGHLLKGHVKQTETLIDETIEVKTLDNDEAEANQIAQELLIGRSGISYDIWKSFCSHEEILIKSREWANRDRVDPAVIIWNIAWNKAQRSPRDKNIWAKARKALNRLESNINAPDLIDRVLDNYIDWDKFRDDDVDYLQAMLNLDSH